MATKSYSKHKEYKEYSSSGNIPYTDEQFDMLKSELIPKGSKLETFGSGGAGSREYHYEYKEEKHPSGKYDRKDLHTVEEYTIPSKPKVSESSSHFYEREERSLPAITGGTRTYHYENTSSSTPGYSKVKSSKVTKELSHNVEELDSLLDDLQKDQERQLYKSGYTSDTAESTSFDYKRGTPVKAPSSGYSTMKREERVESSSGWGGSPPPTRSQEIRQELYREETSESRVSPRPVPACSNCLHVPANGTLPRSGTPMNKVTTTVKTYTYEVPVGQEPGATHSYISSAEEHSNTLKSIPPPSPGCQHCAHCTGRVSTTRTEQSRVLHPVAANTTHVLTETHNGHAPQGPSSYKYSETSYSAVNSSERAFPRPPTPSGTQQPPKKLDDLLAEFPEAKFPTETDGAYRRKTETVRETGAAPAVYYPPGHTPFAQTPDQTRAAYQASSMQGGGAYASGKGMYEYESGAKSKEKRSETKTAVPVCLPLCCAMPCVIM